MCNKNTIHVFVIILLGLLQCSDYNPFTDEHNARAVVIARSFSQRDTVNIFSTESLTILVTVKELIEGISVTSTGNRLWRDTLFTPPMLGRDPIVLLFSFYDTGMHTISIMSLRTTGACDTQEIPVYVRSPLRQDPIIAHLGDSVKIKTPAVGDRGVVYAWTLGALKVSSQICSTVLPLSPSLLSGKGALWVADELYRSPSDSFTFQFIDTTPPIILCLNPGFRGRDTILTSDTVFTLRISIIDTDGRPVDSTTVNGRPFDRRGGTLYYHLFDDMHRHGFDNPLTATVFALDRYSSGNSSSKKFTIIFSDSINQTEKLRILRLSPSNDTLVTPTSSVLTYGRLETTGGRPLNARLEILTNNSLVYTKIVQGSEDAWFSSVRLRLGPNDIRIKAVDLGSGDSTLSSCMVFFDPSTFDTVSPAILSISAEGRPAEGLITEKPRIKIIVHAIDEMSGIDTLTINGRTRLALDSAGALFSDSVNLSHTLSGNEIVVRARDRAGNWTQRSVIVFRNRAPVLEKKPSSILIPADSLYRDTLVAHDPDGDPLTYRLRVAPQGLSISTTGVLLWKPVRGDTGTHSVTTEVWDGYQPVHAYHTLVVYPPGDRPPSPLKFGTTLKEFPQFLTVGLDTLHVGLRVASHSGVGPYVYGARLLGTNRTLPVTSGGVLRWVPSATDTGHQRLLVTVRDQLGKSDSLFPSLWVLGPNRPCTLTSSWKSPIFPDGTLNLNGKKAADTLVFRIRDPDPALSERYDVTIYQARTKSISRIDSAVVDSFSLVLDPTTFDGHDTIKVVVTDRGGHRDTLVLRVYYGSAPVAPLPVFPIDNSFIGGTSTLLAWTGSDPDEDSLWYQVTWGTSLGSVSGERITSETTLPVHGLIPGTTHYWTVVAYDWRSKTAGPVYRFRTGQ